MKLRVEGDVNRGLAALQQAIHDPRKVSADDFPTEGTPEEKLWFALNYAVLAPSSHNSQPWRFRIHGNTVDIYADRTRALPVLDPADRELTMSCGAALYHLRLVFGYFGYKAGVELLPEPEKRDLLARVHLGAKCETDSEDILMFQAIPNRRTNRRPFRNEPVPPPLLATLETAAQAEGTRLEIVETEQARSQVADLIAEADRQQWADRHFRQELAKWIRPTESQARDGLLVITQDLGNLMSHAGPLVIRTFDLGKGRAARDREIALYSPVLALFMTETDDERAWLATGQALARVLLRAQAEDVAASFLNQPIEVPELRPRLPEAINQAGLPQVLVRLGYGEPAAPTARRGVSDVLIHQTS